MPASGIRRVFEQAALLQSAGTTVTMLVIGEPDVAVAPHIGDAARRAWTEDRTDYTPNGGIAPCAKRSATSSAARTASRPTSNRSG